MSRFYRRKRDTFLPWVYLGADFLVVYALLHGVFWFRFSSQFFMSNLAPMDYPVYYRSFHLYALALVFLMRLYGLYRHSTMTLSFSAEVSRILKAVISTFMILTAATFFIRGFTFSRSFLMLSSGVLAIGLVFWRGFAGWVVMSVDRRRGSLRNVLILGCDENAKRLAWFYKTHPRFSTRVVGYLDDVIAKGTLVAGVPVLGKTSEYPIFLKREHEVHELVLGEPGVPQEQALKMIHDCEKELVSFRWVTDLYGLIASKMNVSYVAGVPLLSFVESPLNDWENRLLKRLMDFALSFAALLFLSPFFLLIAVLVRWDSAGPVFYRQERVGEDGRRFWLIKFRTMRQDAEKEPGPVWARQNDDRRTGIGAFLRENNLDELPQLWNVLKGDMSLVGPRPERPHFVSQFKEDIPRYMARHSIRSGITGWAQVNGLRGNTSIEERTKFDLYYIENWSLLFDAKILLKTFFATKNAY